MAVSSLLATLSLSAAFTVVSSSPLGLQQDGGLPTDVPYRTNTTETQEIAQLGNCGSAKWQRLAVRDSWGGANFAPSCAEHDTCYATIGKTKEECDNQFRESLRQECESTYNSAWHVVQRTGCLEMANTYHSAVNRFGGDAYRSAQREAQRSNQGDIASASSSRITGFTGKCLDVDSNQNGINGSTMQLWDCLNPGLNQKWIVDGRLIKSAAYPDMCLDADSNSNGANGTRVQLWECTNVANQRWIIEGSLIKPVAYPGMCLDADSNNDGANGTSIQLWECNNGANQRWQIQ